MELKREYTDSFDQDFVPFDSSAADADMSPTSMPYMDIAFNFPPYPPPPTKYLSLYEQRSPMAIHPSLSQPTGYGSPYSEASFASSFSSQADSIVYDTPTSTIAAEQSPCPINFRASPDLYMGSLSAVDEMHTPLLDRDVSRLSLNGSQTPQRMSFSPLLMSSAPILSAPTRHFEEAVFTGAHRSAGLAADILNLSDWPVFCQVVQFPEASAEKPASPRSAPVEAAAGPSVVEQVRIRHIRQPKARIQRAVRLRKRPVLKQQVRWAEKSGRCTSQVEKTAEAEEKKEEEAEEEAEEEEEDTRLACSAPDCDRRFKNPEHLRRHFDTQHNPNVQWYTCDLCGKKFRGRQDNLRSHVVIHKSREAEEYLARLRAHIKPRRFKAKKTA